MAREGEHNAQLKVSGDTSQAGKEFTDLTKKLMAQEKQIERMNASLARLTQRQQSAETSAKNWGKSIQQTRERTLQVTGGILGAIMMIDRMAQHTVELGGKSDGLAQAWIRMKNAFIDEGGEVLLTVDKLGGIFAESATAVGQFLGLVDETSESLFEGVGAIEAYLYSFGPWGVALAEAAGALGTLIDQAESLDGVIGKGDRSGLGVALLGGDADSFLDAVERAADYGYTLNDITVAQREFEASIQGTITTLQQQARMFEHLEAIGAPTGTENTSAEAARQFFRGAGRRRAGKRSGARETPLEDMTAAESDDATAELRDMQRAEREALSEHADAYLEQQLDFEQRKLDLELETELQRIAMREELGLLDPMEQLELERDAQLEHIEGLRRMTSDEVELARLKNQEDLVYHQAKVRRLEIERQAEIRKWNTTREIASATSQIIQGGIQTGAMAADLFIVNERRREQAMYATAAVSALVVGIEQQVHAIAAFASFNYVQGALHQAAAIFAFAQSGMLFAKAGGAGSRSGGISMGGMTGGMGAANGPANGPGGEGLQNQIQSDVPPSQAPTARGPRRGEQPAGGNVFHIGQINGYAATEGEFVRTVARELDVLGRDVRRVS